MVNLLAQAAENGTLGYGVTKIANVDLNWIGKLIYGLIGGIGIVGVGIIVFTLILKTIVLPLDIYSRIKTKKQALIMERMRPQMEKLQKQYANDKNMYNQKVMELQKASGYSMFGACLPMIVSLVIFIVVFSAFSTYSQFANLDSYNHMVDKYNGVVQAYVYDETENPQGFLQTVWIAPDGTQVLVESEKQEGVKYKTDYTVKSYENFISAYNADNETAYTTEAEVFNALAEKYQSKHTGFNGAFDLSLVNPAEGQPLSQTNKDLRNTLVSFYLEEPAAQAVKKYYEAGNNDHFLWVKNLWYPDSTLNKAVPDFSKFQSTISKAAISDNYAESYNKVTAALTVQKGQYNGYFILIVLSIGLMLLQQFISMRANKSVNELSTVDGSGSRTNKWMLILMPVIYGIFSFFYSASFSLYMITNTLYGLITMLIINKCVDVWFKKKEEAGELDKILSKKKKVRARAKTSGNYRRK